MAFSYIIMQTIPPTSKMFTDTSLPVSTFANIVYGKKRYTFVTVTFNIILVFYRAPKQVDITVLGGVTLKTPLPTDADALSDFLLNYELRLPPGPLTTIYRVEFQGVTYYSRAYERVKKRNSYTVMYCSNGQERFGIIDSYTTRFLLF